jgi:hypothetical protein
MSQILTQQQEAYSPGFHVTEKYAFKSERGLSKKIEEAILEREGARRVVVRKRMIWCTKILR